MKKEKQVPDGPNVKKKPFAAPKGVAVLLAILLCIFTVIGLLGFNVWRVLFNPALVEKTLTEEVVSSDIVPAALELFSEHRAQQRAENQVSLSGVNEPDIVLLLSFLDADGWLEIKELLVTDAFVVDVVSASVDGMYIWIDSDDIWPDIRWDMSLFKERLGGQEGVDAIMVAYSALPEATEEDIADFEHRLSQVPEGVEVLYNLAQFPEPWTEDQIADYIDALESANDNLPEIFQFSQQFGQQSDESRAGGLVMLKKVLRTVRFIAIFGWAFALFVLALLFIFNVRSRKTLGKYVGIPMLVGGAVTTAIALAGQSLVINMISRSFAPAMSEFARTEIAGSLQRLSALFFTPLLIQSAVVVGIGIILIIVMSIKKKKAAEPAHAAQSVSQE